MSIFNELKRRNVFRVGIAYAVVSWLVLQVADVMIDNIGAPDWLFGSILLVLAIGLPVVLVFAWAFELTPEGIKRDHEVDRSQSIAPQTGRRLDRTIIVVLALALGYFVWDKLSGEAPSAEPELAAEAADPEAPAAGEEAALERSIAVLPFVNMSADADNEYFSDGLSEELLNLLARVEGLKVAARTSTFKFKGSEADIGEIGETLNVATVLEGSVRKAGDQVRITAQLIKVDDGFHLWSQTYDRRLDNIFEVQDEIATAIVDALRLPLLGEGQAPLATVQAASIEAYDLYLLGKHHARAITGEGFEKAIEYFTRAVELDPDFAPAWSELASSWMFAADFGGRSQNEAIPEAEAAVERALALDPGSADAYTSKATILSYQSRDVESLEAIEKALQLEPNDPRALLRKARQITSTDPDQALELASRAIELDPLGILARTVMITTKAAADGRGTAEALFLDYLERDPDNPGLYEAWAFVEQNTGNPDRAIANFTREWELRPGDAFPAFQNVLNYLMLSDDERAEAWAERARERAPNTVWAARSWSMLAYYRGEFETLLAGLMAANETQASGNTQFIAFTGDTLLQLGRLDEAEAAYRQALDQLRVDPSKDPTEDEAELVLTLATLLSEGAERERLLERARRRLDLLEENGVDDRRAAYLQAGLAANEGNREALFTALDRMIDRGYRGARWLELDPVFHAWHDDPRFREALGRLNRISDEILARMEETSA